MGLKGRALAWQAPVRLSFTFPTNAAILTAGDTPAFIADADYELESVAERHETIGGDGGAVTLDIVKVSASGVAVGAGTSMLASTFDLKSTANTNVRKDRTAGGLSTTRTATRLAKGNVLGINLTGTLTNVTGVCVTIVLQPITKAPVW